MRFVGMRDEGIFRSKTGRQAGVQNLSQWFTGTWVKLEKQETSHETKIFQLVLEVILSIHPQRDSQLLRYGERQTPVGTTERQNPKLKDKKR